jgi:hypothetical protein
MPSATGLPLSAVREGESAFRCIRKPALANGTAIRLDRGASLFWFPRREERCGIGFSNLASRLRLVLDKRLVTCGIDRGEK